MLLLNVTEVKHGAFSVKNLTAALQPCHSVCKKTYIRVDGIVLREQRKQKTIIHQEEHHLMRWRSPEHSLTVSPPAVANKAIPTEIHNHIPPRAPAPHRTCVEDAAELFAHQLQVDLVLDVQEVKIRYRKESGCTVHHPF